MSLPGYPREEERKEEEDYNCYPERHRDRYEEYKDWHPGNQYCQCPTNGEDSPRGSYAYDIRRGKENIKSVSRQPSQKKYRQEVSSPYCPDEETPQEIQAYHIEQYMPNTAVDKYAAYDSPRLLRKCCPCQAKKEDNFIDNLAILYDGIRADCYLQDEYYYI